MVVTKLVSTSIYTDGYLVTVGVVAIEPTSRNKSHEKLRLRHCEVALFIFKSLRSIRNPVQPNLPLKMIYDFYSGLNQKLKPKLNLLTRTNLTN